MTSNKFPEDPSTATNYKLWRKDVLIWKKLTSIERNKQGLALQYVCKGNDEIHEAVTNIEDEKVECAEGFNNVLAVLDKFFNIDKRDIEIKECSEFESLIKEEQQTMANFVNMFDSLYNKTKVHGNSMSDNMLVTKLLKAANITQSQKQMIDLVYPDGKYDDIKTALKHMFGETMSAAACIKTEPSSSSLLAQKKCMCNQGQQSDSTSEDSSGYEAMYGERQKKWFKSKKGRMQNHNKSHGQNKKGKNPLDQFGNITRCDICESINHWADKCPDKEDTKRRSYFEIQLFQSPTEDTKQIRNLIHETIGAGIADCGASKTVCGKKWLDTYIKLLSPEDRKDIETKTSHNMYKFGVGSSKAFETKNIPIYLGSKRCMLECDVIKDDIPLLLSRFTMKKAKSILDTKNDTIKMLGEEIKLINTTSGHYAVPLCPSRNIFKPTVTTKSEIKVQPPKPVSATSSQFNEIVAIDIKYYHGAPLLHLIDTCTLFSATVVLKSKEAKEVVDNIFQVWINTFGCPQKFTCDNRMDFKSQEFTELTKSLNMNILITPVNSPYSNKSLCEHYNFLLEDMIDRMREVDCSLTVAVAWAVNALNSSNNDQGFSPSQLVFGYNPILPSVRNGKPPALSKSKYSDIITEHFQTMKIARVAHIKAKTSERVRQALNDKNWSCSDNKYLTYDMVHYRKEANKSWQGPGTMIDQDGQYVLVRDQSTCFRLHPFKLQTANEIKIELEKNENSDEHKGKVDAQHQDEVIVDENIQVSLHEKYEVDRPDEMLVSKVYNTSAIKQKIKLNEKDTVETDKEKDFLSQKWVSRLKIEKNSLVFKNILRIMLVLITTGFLFTCMNVSHSIRINKETNVYHHGEFDLHQWKRSSENVNTEYKTNKGIGEFTPVQETKNIMRPNFHELLKSDKSVNITTKEYSFESILVAGFKKHIKNRVTRELASLKKGIRVAIINLVFRTNNTSVQVKEKGEAVDISIKEKGAAVDITIICYTANISMAIGCWPF